MRIKKKSKSKKIINEGAGNVGFNLEKMISTQPQDIYLFESIIGDLLPCDKFLPLRYGRLISELEGAAPIRCWGQPWSRGAGADAVAKAKLVRALIPVAFPRARSSATNAAAEARVGAGRAPASRTRARRPGCARSTGACASATTRRLAAM